MWVVRLVARVLLFALLPAGCTGGDANSADAPATTSASTSSGPTEPSEPVETTPTAPPPPLTGRCRTMTFSDTARFSNDTRPTRCRRVHTAYTFAVHELPGAIASHVVNLDDDELQAAASGVCHRDFARFIGGTSADRARSRLTVTYFLPAQRAYDLGARWVRCDVVALERSNVLARLPVKLKGLLDHADALDRFGVCSTKAPDSASTRLVMCTQPHTYRALAALRLGTASAEFPGAAVVQRDSRKRCGDLVGDTLGLAGGYQFGWTYPTPDDWKAGQRFGFCWLQSSS